MKSVVRRPVVANTFYPGDEQVLLGVIKRMVVHDVPKAEAVGIICPHAAYSYSGEIAAATIARVRVTESVIILGPNHTGRGRPYACMSSGSWITPFGSVEVDHELASKLIDSSLYLEEDEEAHLLEHSIEVLIPLLQYFKRDIKVVPIVLSEMSSNVCKEIGQSIAEVLGQTGGDVLIIASCDMTHYESYELAKEKDESALQAILDLDEVSLLKRISEQNITMCGYSPVAVLLAASKAMGAWQAELVRYQTSGDVSGDYSSVVGYAGIVIPRVSQSPLVALARKSIENYLKTGYTIPCPSQLTDEMSKCAGVFVSIYKKNDLRGCIGTFEPSRRNVAEETIINAISAATRDPRFDPVTLDEVNDLEISVDVLSQPEEVAGVEWLDPHRYGLIVVQGKKRGLLLPNLSGVDTVEQQVEICRRKADIGNDESVKLFRFEVMRFH